MYTQISPRRSLFVRTTAMAALGGLVCVLLATGASLLSPRLTAAATSSTINFQARLETSAGAVAPDGNYNVSFHLFSSSTAVGGTSTDTGCGTDTSCEWSEQYTYNSGAGASDARIRVVNGYLTVNLGSLTAFSGINWNQQQWLTMDIGGTVGSGTITWDGQMSPRLLLTATPYAFQAGGLSVTSGSNTDSLVMTTPASASHTITVPDETGTICTTAGSTACTSVYAAADGSGSYIQNGTTTQAANFNVQGSSGTAAAAVIQANNGGSGDILDLKNGSGVLVTTISNTGSVLHKTSTNSTTAFQIQNASSQQVLGVDTSSGKVNVGAGSALNGSLVFNNATNGNAITLTTGATASSYTLTLPTATPAAGLCLQTSTASASQLVFASCANTNASITEVQEWDSTSSTTLNDSPANLGDVIMLSTQIPASGVSVSSVSGGGVSTWTKVVANSGNGTVNRVEIWMGTVATTGAGTITVTYSGAQGANEMTATEFTAAGVTANTTWGVDTSGSQLNSTSSTTVTYPSLVSEGNAEIYYGYAQVQNSPGLAGSTSGFTYIVTGTQKNVIAYATPTVANTTYQPTANQNTSGQSNTAGVIITAFINSTAINNSTSLQKANFYVQAASSGSVAGVLQANASGSADILDLRNSSGVNVMSVGNTGSVIHQTTTNSTTAFQIQNANGTSLFGVDTTTPGSNLLTNPGFEVNTTGWAASGTGASIARNTTAANTYEGVGSLAVTLGSGASTGAAITNAGYSGASIAAGTYTFGFYAKGSTTLSGLAVSGFNGGTCTLNITSVPSTGFQHYFCTVITTGATTGNITITVTTASQTLYLDAAQLVSGSALPAFGYGTLQLRGTLTTPLALQNTANSTTAFQIQNASSANILDVDTVNGFVGIGTASPTANLNVNGSTILQGTATIENTVGTNSNDLNIQRSGTISPTNIAYTFSERSDNTDLWLYGYDGTTFWDPVKLLWNGGSGNQILALGSDGGKVGVGTASPQYTLDVAGTARVQTSTNSTTAFQIQNSSGANLFTADTSNGNLVFGNDGTPSALTVRGGAATGSSVVGSNITFDASNGTGQANSGDFIFRSATGANQVGFDNSATGNASASSLTISYTTGSQSNRLMMVSIATKGTISGTTVPKYNGVNLTKLGSTLTAGASTSKGEVWYLVAPASGTHSLVITATASTDLQVVVATFYNVDQTTPLGTQSTSTGTGATASATVTTSTTQTVVSTVTSDGNVDVVNNQSQTALGNINLTSMSGMSYEAAQGTSTTMSWNLDGSNGGNYAVTAVPINAIASSPTSSDTLAERVRIDAQGRIGIGTATPGDQLDVAGGGLRFQTSGSTLNLASDVLGNTFNIKIPAKTTSASCASGNAEGLRFLSPGGTIAAGISSAQVGHICLSGAGTHYKLDFFADNFTATSTDVAENYSDKDNSLQPGDLVSLDPTTHKGVKKTSGIQDPGMIGIVSTDPGLTLSDISDADGSTELAHPKPIALSGRVPTKVSTINGEIHVGDYLTSSSIPGVAMKATTAGQTVARALEDYTNPDPNAVGSILSFVNLSWADPSPQSVVNPGDQLQASLSNPAIFRAATDSTQAFEVQNAQGETLLSADTAHMTVTVKNLVVTNTLTVNGHIVTGGTTPTAQVLIAGAPNISGQGPVCSATGNDTSGSIQLSVGVNDLSSGVTCDVTFAQPYSQPPRTVFSPTNQDSIGLDMYVTTSPTDMELHFTQALPAGHIYVFNYVNLQ